MLKAEMWYNIYISFSPSVQEDLPQQLPDSGPPSPEVTEKHWDKQEELQRQKTLLEESRKRLEGMKKQGWNKQGLRESLVEMQKRLSKQVDQLGKREEWKRKHQEHNGEKKEGAEERTRQSLEEGWGGEGKRVEAWEGQTERLYQEVQRRVGPQEGWEKTREGKETEGKTLGVQTF